MRNVLHILSNDLKQLLRSPAAVIVVVALITLPSLYTWYNVLGFWDPYQNTDKFQVVVVNEDKGGYTELTGEMDVGDKIVEALHGNDSLGWLYEDREEAMRIVESGKAFAAFVIPPDFTSDLLTLVTGDYKKPDIEFYVNEKYGPVAAKIADTGSTTLEETVNAEFVTTVSQTAVAAFDKALEKFDSAESHAKSQALTDIDNALANLRSSEDSLQTLYSIMDAAKEDASGLKQVIENAEGSLAGVAGDLDALAAQASGLKGMLSDLSSKAQPIVTNALSTVSKAAAQASAAAAKASAQVSSIRAQSADVAAGAQSILDSVEGLVDELGSALEGLPADSDARTELEQLVAYLENVVSELEEASQTASQMGDELGMLAESTLSDIGTLADAAETASDAGSLLSGALFEGALPATESVLGTVSSTATQAAAFARAQAPIVARAAGLAGNSISLIDDAHEAVEGTEGLLRDIESTLDTARTDIAALGASNLLADFLGPDAPAALDSQTVGAFIGAPTQLKTVQLYKTGTYGEEIAPLFMNLTLWIGAFMIMVIFRVQVSRKEAKGTTSSERYISRYLLFAMISVLQAAVCCAGLPVIGMHAVSWPALFGAAIMASLAYLSVIYALTSCFQHIGMGVAIALVFLQIPAATGLYPIEMTAPFFQAVYPLFPFTYAIAAMRESISGFYGLDYLGYIGMLVLFFAVAMAFGLFAKPRLKGFNRRFARQVAAGGVFVGEKLDDLPGADTSDSSDGPSDDGSGNAGTVGGVHKRSHMRPLHAHAGRHSNG